MPNISKLSTLEIPGPLTTRTGLIPQATPVISYSKIPMLNSKRIIISCDLPQSCSFVILQGLTQSILKWTLKNSQSKYFSDLDNDVVVVVDDDVS